MTKFTVNKDWDQLQSCVIGTVYPVGHFSNIKNIKLQDALDTILYETEQDFQLAVQCMMQFDLEIWRPTLPLNTYMNAQYTVPPINVRNYISVADSTLYLQNNSTNFDFLEFYHNVKDQSWPDCKNLQEFNSLSANIRQECIEIHGLYKNINQYNTEFGSWRDIFKHVKSMQINIKEIDSNFFSSSMMICAGNVKLFTIDKQTNPAQAKLIIDAEFPNTVNHIIQSSKRLSEICVIPREGLIICAEEIPELKDIFKDWEIVVADDCFEHKKKWSITGVDCDHELSTMIETHFQTWTRDATILNSAVDMIVLNDNNIIIDTTNESILKKLQSYAITPHIVSLQQRGFWGIGLRNTVIDLYRSSSI
jgi:hypothetical protein